MWHTNYMVLILEGWSILRVYISISFHHLEHSTNVINKENCFLSTWLFISSDNCSNHSQNYHQKEWNKNHVLVIQLIHWCCWSLLQRCRRYHCYCWSLPQSSRTRRWRATGSLIPIGVISFDFQYFAEFLTKETIEVDVNDGIDEGMWPTQKVHSYM